MTLSVNDEHSENFEDVYVETLLKPFLVVQLYLRVHGHEHLVLEFLVCDKQRLVLVLPVLQHLLYHLGP